MTRTLRVSCVALFLITTALALPARVANCALASPAQAADEAALRTLIERYFAAYADKDLDAMTRLWSDKSPDLAPAKDRLKEFFSRNKQVETKNRRFRQLKIEADHASALVTFEVTAIDAMNKPALGLGKRSQNIRFVKEAGEWKIQQDTSAEAELAARLIATESEEERTTLLASDSELLTVELRKALLQQNGALIRKGSYAQALAVFALAGKIAEQIDDSAGLAQVAIGVGFVRRLQGSFDPSMESYQKALALCEKLGQKDCAASALIGIGIIHHIRTNYDQAADYYRKALAIGEELGDKNQIASALNNLGLVQKDSGNYAAAFEHYQKSMSIFEAIGDRSGMVSALSNMARVDTLRGDLDQAIDYFQRAKSLSEAAGNKPAIASGLNDIGIIYRLRGNFGSAMTFFQKSLAAQEALGNKSGIAYALSNIGIVHFQQGNLTLALEYIQRSLAMEESLGDKAAMVNDRNNLGLVYSGLGDYGRALECYEKNLAFSETLRNKSAASSALTNIGEVYRSQGRYDLALENYNKSLQIKQERGDKPGIAVVLNNMGLAYYQQGGHSRAAEFAERSASLSRETGDRTVLVRALTTAGNAYQALGETNKASGAFREAISTTEALRVDAGGGEQEQQQLFEKRVSPYYRMVELLVGQGEAGEALSFAERAKARVLLDVLRSGKIDVTKAMTLEEKAQEQKIKSALVFVNSQLSRESRRSPPDQTRLAQLKKDLEKARLDSQDFQSRLYAAHPELQIQRGETQQFRTEDAAGVGANASTALLEYVVSDDKTYLFVLTGRTNGVADVKVYTIPIKRKELATQVETFREKLASHNLLVRQPAREAYDLLLKPAQALLRNKTQLIIVPDDVLWELPFQALMNEANHYLIEQSAISYAPSLTVLREMNARRKERPAEGRSISLLALGNPALDQETIQRVQSTRRDEKLEPLPEAEREVETLARLYGASKSEIFIGAEAREDRAKTEAGKFRVLHFATHGVVNNVSPMYSHLVLSQGNQKEDGLLEAWELLNLDLKADLVVLSACETARGRVGAGEGMIGLSWALFVAGTPTTVVSQWKVDSTSTTELMLEFHRNRLAANSTAQSLRKAMLKMLGSNQYKHPFYWAPFVVIGAAN